jgi:outer membrane protein
VQQDKNVMKQSSRNPERLVLRGTCAGLLLFSYVVHAATPEVLPNANPLPSSPPVSSNSSDFTAEETPPIVALKFPPSNRPLVTLDEALKKSIVQQPNLRQAEAQVEAMEGRATQVKSAYLPQVTGTLTYQRTTGNFAPRPGATVNTANVPPATNTLYNTFTAQLFGTQLLYDFGQTANRIDAANANVETQKASLNTVRNQTKSNVYYSYFQAVAGRAMVIVAEESLANQERHLNQIDAIVRVGIRPEIDRTQAKAEVATARLSLISARNNYESAKALLNQAMGVVANTDFDVEADELGPVSGEHLSPELLVTTAMTHRPEVQALEKQRLAQQAALRALRGAYGPTINATAAASEGGTQLDNMRYNWYIGVNLTWPILQGGLTHGQIHEAAANLDATAAQIKATELQVRTQIVQAQLALVAAKESITQAEDAVQNLSQRLKLAEGRYTSGIGNIIELTDAQVAYFAAQGQLIYAHFNQSLARAQLLLALGKT